MNHTLIASTPITDLTFKAILKEFVSSAIGNRKAFHPKPQSTPKTSIQPCTNGVTLTVTPMVTAATSTSLLPLTKLIMVEVPLRLDIKQQCLKVPGLRLIDLSLVR